MPKYVLSNARKNVFPAKPKYSLASLKQAGTELKKAMGLKVAITKMNKSQLINLLSDNGYPLSDVAKFSKVNIPKKRGRKPKDYVAQVQNKMGAMNVGNAMTNDIFASVLNQIPNKKKRGPKKGSKNKKKN